MRERERECVRRDSVCVRVCMCGRIVYEGACPYDYISMPTVDLPLSEGRRGSYHMANSH